MTVVLVEGGWGVFCCRMLCCDSSSGRVLWGVFCCRMLCCDSSSGCVGGGGGEGSVADFSPCSPPCLESQGFQFDPTFLYYISSLVLLPSAVALSV